MKAIIQTFQQRIFNQKMRPYIIGLVTLGVIIAPQVLAGGGEGGHGAEAAATFLLIAILLVAAKLSSVIEKWGQPAVLGELLIGVILGNLALLGIHYLEPLAHNHNLLVDFFLPIVHTIESIGHNGIIAFLAELGVVVLLFQIGLESNIAEMKKVGMRAFLVAILGVVIPFVLGTYIVGPWLMPGLSSNAYLFLGATLTATSVGITARVFKDLGKLKLKEAQIVLGAAVIDDVLGLIILAVVSAIVTIGAVSMGGIVWIIVKSILFLAGSVIIGQLLAKQLGKLLSKIHTGVGMKFTLAICFALIFAYLAQRIGLAPIIGAFAAGLVLDPVQFVYFKNPQIVDDIKDTLKHENEGTKERLLKVIGHHKHKHIEEIIEPLSFFLVPLFFVITGFQVKLDTLFDIKILGIALAITAAAVIGKVAAGYVAGNVRKGLVGWGMVPRGEVGLIFAAIGKSLGVVNDEIYSIIVIMVILTTLMTPPILNSLLKKMKTE